MADLRVSIVTVCLNQAGTLERTLRSVLDRQGCPVEYILIDGGSTDGTGDLLDRYRSRLAYCVSEPDRGQSHALNKGFARATGDIVGWLNADDELAPAALQSVIQAFEQRGCDVLCGACRYIQPDGCQIVRAVRQKDLRLLRTDDVIHQPSCFWRRDLHERVGALDEHLHYGMDWDLWLRFQRAGARFETTQEVLSVYHVSGFNKTSTGGDRRNRELYELLCRYNAGASRCRTEVAYRLLGPLKRLRRREPIWLFQPLSNAARTAALLGLGPFLGFDRLRRCAHPFT